MWISTNHNSFTILQYQPWLDRGWIHGFLGKSQLDRTETLKELEGFFDLESLVGVKQTHSNIVIDFLTIDKSEIFEADGICRYMSKTGSSDNDKSGLFIKTADCLPILMKSAEYSLVVHAGWRGLANNIIVNSLEALSLSKIEQLEVLIGPAACSRCYEVGSEVIDQIGAVAVYYESNSTCFLDLTATAKAQLVFSGIKADNIKDTGVCTIEVADFNSHRRAPDCLERNISFLI